MKTFIDYNWTITYVHFNNYDFNNREYGMSQ